VPGLRLKSFGVSASAHSSERGSAIVTVLVLAAVTAVISAGFLYRALHEANLATRSHYQTVALNLAEAGIEEGLHAANSSMLDAAHGWTLASGSSTDYVKTITSGFDFQQATGSVHVRVDGSTSETPTITAAAVLTIANQPKVVKQLRVGLAAPGRLFANSIVSKDRVRFTGSADIDSYDSTLGAYSRATNRSDRATVATLGTVQVSGSAEIYGYVATAGSTPSVGGGGRIYGATSPSSPLVDPSRVRSDFTVNLVDATAPTGSAYSLGSYSLSSSTVSLPRVGDVAGANGRYLYTCTALSLSGSGRIKVMGPVDVVVTGAVSIGGSASIAVGGTGAVNPSFNLYAPGTIDLGGLGIANDTNLAINVSIWGTKPSGSTQSISVRGSTAFNATIYAPNGDVSISGGSVIYGAVIARSVTLTGEFHYDVRLATTAVAGGPNPGVGSSGTGTFRVRAWSELTGRPGTSQAFARDNRQPFAALF
jgi:hypothetical protein